MLLSLFMEVCMSTLSVDTLRKMYFESVRNLRPEIIARIESGEPCQSRLMKYAQECYMKLRATEEEETTKADGGEPPPHTRLPFYRFP